MGKCASKQQQQQKQLQSPPKYHQKHHSKLLQQQILNLYKNGCANDNGTIGARTTTTISISEQNIYLLIENEGQSESKKRSMSLETKGTAMSFGFKKKLLPSHKKSAKAKEIENNQNDFKNSNLLTVDNAYCVNDSNGNSVESFDTLSDKETTGRSTPRLSPPRKESAGAPYRSTRFGFRKSNIVRPSSTGITSQKISIYDNVANNNNSKFNAKPRSKSACSSSRSAVSSATSGDSHPKQPTVHFQLQSPQPHELQLKRNNPKIDNESINATGINTNSNNNRCSSQQQRKLFFMQTNAIQNDFNQNKPPSGKRSYTVINTELHTNEIVRPTPLTATTIVSKFTLHTSSLPKPQYPVPISLAPPPNYAMDTKNAKQAANNTKKGFQAQREISADSGIGSMSSQIGSDVRTSPQRQRHRPRNLEMIFSGRNKFHVRDLTDESLSDENIQPLALPQLPTAYDSANQPANLSGLIRVDNTQSNNSGTQAMKNKRIDSNMRQSSINSINSETIEEEKVFRDNSMTEKHSNRAADNTYSSKNSSATSSIIGLNAGEVMAAKDGISVSSSDSFKENGNEHKKQVQQHEYDDEFSTLTMTTDNKFSLLSSSITMPKSELGVQCDELFDIEDNANNFVQNSKFAALTAAVSDILLDDETSPSDSLISSTASDDVSPKKNKKKINDSIKESEEKDIDEISPIFDVASPLSHGTPTHATNSFSFSDGEGARDFLIDDEIADQPVLCFGENHASNTQLHSIIDTPTLMDTNTSAKTSSNLKRTPASNNSINNSYAPQVKPRHSLLSRTESLDTLSPCESICSDDLMMDFECNSSIDSIDRISRSNHSGSGTGINQVDEAQLWSEFEQNGSGLFKDWSYLLKTSRNKCKDISISQLPARSTRLLNRSRLQQNTLSNNGSDSPHSINSLNLNSKPASRTSSSSLFGRDNINGSPDDHLFMLDKTLRNSMIQDVQYCKQQLLQLRSILQDDEECLMRTSSLNPFENNNGKFFDTSGGYESLLANIECMERENNYSPSLSDDPKHDLVDLRRQVVYLQGQLDDKDRTIRIQQNLITKLEAEVDQAHAGKTNVNSDHIIETVNTATQTDRMRPLSMNFDGSPSNRSEDDETASIKTNASSTSASVSSTSKSLGQNNSKCNGIDSSKSSTVVKKITSTVRTSHVGNGKSTAVSLTKTISDQSNALRTPQKPVTTKSTPTTPTFGRIPRVIRTTPTKDDESSNIDIPILRNGMPVTNGKYFKNIVGDATNGSGKAIAENGLNMQIAKTPIKSVKMLNNLNVLKSKGFSVPVKSDDDF